MTFCRCAFFGLGMKRHYEGWFSTKDQKKNKPETTIWVDGLVKKCPRCKRESIKTYAWYEARSSAPSNLHNP